MGPIPTGRSVAQAATEEPPLNADLLLHWMSHLGEGSWSGFKNNVSKLIGPDADLDGACRTLRISLSDLGYADFFAAGSQRWQVLPPMLAGLPRQDVALLIGARSPTLVDHLASAARAHWCTLAATEHDSDLPVQVRIEGTSDALAAVAADVGIEYSEDLALRFCGELDPISSQLAAAPEESPPGNWAVRSFDFRSLRWIAGLRTRTACEFTSRYGPKRFFFSTRQARLLRLSKRVAVYAAAALRGVALASYDSADSTLSCPISTPLPEHYSRIACLCSGRLASVRQGALVYSGIPIDIAAVLLVAAGQAYPQPHQARASGESAESAHGQSL